MDESTQERSFRNIFSRQQNTVHIIAYHVGDVLSTQAVEIGSEATLVGHVIAPVVHVHGLVYGSILAQETAVYPGGQIWGDVYTAKLSMEPNGSIQGWISTIEKSTFAEYAEKSTYPQPDPPDLPGDIQIAAPDEQELAHKKILQQTAALALAARAEIEGTFEARLQAMAGKIKARNTELVAELETAVSAQDTLRIQYKKAQDDLATRISQQNQLTQEVQIARTLLTKREAEIAALQNKTTRDQAKIKTLYENLQAVEATLTTQQTQYTTLLQRHENLETALQASLEHTNDLEESLLRWQELAEYAEGRATGLEEKQIGLQAKIEVAQAAQAKTQAELIKLTRDFKSAQATIETQTRLIKQLEHK